MISWMENLYNIKIGDDSNMEVEYVIKMVTPTKNTFIEKFSVRENAFRWYLYQIGLESNKDNEIGIYRLINGEMEEI